MQKLNLSIAIRRKKGEIVLESKKIAELLKEQKEKFKQVAIKADFDKKSLRGMTTLKKSSSI